MKGNNILITGICGFIGSNCALSLSKNNNILGVDNFSYSVKKQYEEIKPYINEFYEGDVSNPKTFKKLPKNIDYILHFGAPSSIVLFKNDLLKKYSETVLGMLNVFEFAKEINARVIYPSSGSIYGNNEIKHTTNDYPKPKNIYGAAKLACEGIASSYSDFVSSTGLRIFAGYGKREEYKGDFSSVIYIFIKSIMDDKSPIIYGNGTQTRDFIPINDIVTVIEKKLNFNTTEVLDVGSGKPTSFNRIIELINQKLSKNIKPQYIKKDKDYVENLMSNNNYLDRLNIKITPIENGISEFINYLNTGV